MATVPQALRDRASRPPLLTPDELRGFSPAEVKLVLEREERWEAYGDKADGRGDGLLGVVEDLTAP